VDDLPYLVASRQLLFFNKVMEKSVGKRLRILQNPAEIHLHRHRGGENGQTGDDAQAMALTTLSIKSAIFLHDSVLVKSESLL
jgi:hypothetical protein